MTYRFLSSLTCILGLSLLAAGAAPAQGVSGTDPATRPVVTDDCKARAVDYSDEAELTREERIARMDRALTRSLDRFVECQSTQAGTASGAAGNGEGGMAGAGEGRGGGQGQAQGTGEGVASTASSDMSGTEASDGAAAGAPGQSSESTIRGEETGTGSGTASRKAAKAAPSGSWTPVDDPKEGDSEAPNAEGPNTEAGDRDNANVPADTAARDLSNGAVPADIPPADNDSVLEAQIRKAAMEETDPELKKKLWNEYRRYKGLPQKE